MFNAMLTRSRNKKGFTLMEMLIVVAIIAILVAVSFPVFTAQLNKAELATDQANVRAAKAVALATYLTSESTIADQYYDAGAGKLVTDTDDAKKIRGYCQGVNPVEDTGATSATSGKKTAKGEILKVSVNSANGEFTAEWVAVPTA